MDKAEEWAIEQWGGAGLGDERRTQRAVLLGTVLAANPGSGLPKQTDQWGDLKAAYRLLSNDAVSHEALQEGHWAQVRQLALAQDRVLFIQGTTELDYTKHNAVEGLGPIGNHAGKGLLAHSCFAVTPAGTVLGLAYQQVWTRQDCAFKPAESRCERARRENKESAVWARTLTGIGQAPMDAQWVSVGDPGSDIFAYWRQARESGWYCLLRVFVDRRIEPRGPADHLLAHARQLPPMAQGELTLRARPGKAARVVDLQIAWSMIRVRAPRNEPGSAQAPALEASVIRVWEQEDGGLEWNRSRLGIIKTHALDAACVGVVHDVRGAHIPTLRVTCTGRGSRCKTCLNKYGFPRGYLTRKKTAFGFRTGDMVAANVPSGKNQGCTNTAALCSVPTGMATHGKKHNHQGNVDGPAYNSKIHVNRKRKGCDICDVGSCPYRPEGRCFSEQKLMKIPEELKIPAIVFTLEAIMVTGFLLIFFVLVPH